MFRDYLKQLIIIIILIAVCAVIARVMNGGETLAEYAAKHPDKAYSTQSEDVIDD
ncbi:hypothetical protein [Butyrivibrio sp. WCD3002]|jgi:uncharacterized alpha/beta hydrolase family protein|uniref:hypothetical protein n=1 Tax=Butyrivibrio sp. WCD3002 TaxID=1280676 RepID=UPI000412152C|nr:hypothetical protein [Butyrivibrio sp. WCD3002]